MILVGDNRVTLPTIERGSVQCVATSPPYFGLRLYGDAGEEIGKERDIAAYVRSIVDVMALCRDALRDDGVAWVNLGDSYASSGCGPQGDSPAARPKNTEERASTGRIVKGVDGLESGNALLVPFRVAMALQQDGWTLRAMLPWIKLASMPESVQSRPSMAHEYVLFLTKRPSGYFYDADAVRVAHLPKSEERYKTGFRPKRDPNAINGSLADRMHAGIGSKETLGESMNPAGRSLRSSDFWRAGARSAAEQLQQAADGQAIGLVTNDDAPAALVVNPKGSGIEHFAMWPTRLVAPMIMAGTPEAGSCSVCGAPWERVVETERLRAATPSGMRETGRWAGGQESGIGGRMRRSSLGFRPSCAHADAPARPAIVLDPFVGAGTTVGVAEALGRQAIGCELYQANADLMPRRIDVVRTEMIEILKEQGNPRAGDVEQAQKADRHKGAVRQDDGPLFGGKL